MNKIHEWIPILKFINIYKFYLISNITGKPFGAESINRLNLDPETSSG